MLMPSHARKVHLWPDQGQSLFARFQVEAQLDAMMQPTVQLRSGGYLVINQAEALVAIDVNSGRSTRERNVEETALRTNLEAADEVARQLRLRDLAGLIVIDLIDMESKRHNAMVERRLKEALKDDRARIQVGHISHFGLLEMSRQRLRPSLEETTLIICPHCNGTGHVRGTESAALHVLRGVEEEAGKRRSAEIIVHVAMAIALYILNHKRERLNEIERRYGMRVIIAADDSLIAPRFRIERLRTLAPGEEPRFVTPDAPRSAVVPLPISGRRLCGAPEPVDVEEDEDIAEAELTKPMPRRPPATAKTPKKAAKPNAAAAAVAAGGAVAERMKPRLPDATPAPDLLLEPAAAAGPTPIGSRPADPEPAERGPGGLDLRSGDDDAARRRSRRGDAAAGARRRSVAAGCAGRRAARPGSGLRRPDAGRSVRQRPCVRHLRRDGAGRTERGPGEPAAIWTAWPLAAGPAGSRRIGLLPRNRRCWRASQPQQIVPTAARRPKTGRCRRGRSCCAGIGTRHAGRRTAVQHRQRPYRRTERCQRRRLSRAVPARGPCRSRQVRRRRLLSR